MKMGGVDKQALLSGLNEDLSNYKSDRVIRKDDIIQWAVDSEISGCKRIFNTRDGSVIMGVPCTHTPC